MNFSINRKLALVVGISLVIGGVGLSVDAQQTNPGYPPPANQQTDITLNSQEIDSFAKALISVEQIRADFQRRITPDADAKEVQALNQEYAQEVHQAVQNNGLTLEKYQRILQAAQQDKALQQRVTEKIEEQGGGTPGH